MLGRTDNPNSDNLEEDEIATFFRVNTEDLTESEKDQLREELKEYLEFMKSRLKTNDWMTPMYLDYDTYFEYHDQTYIIIEKLLITMELN